MFVVCPASNRRARFRPYLRISARSHLLGAAGRVRETMRAYISSRVPIKRVRHRQRGDRRSPPPLKGVYFCENPAYTLLFIQPGTKVISASARSIHERRSSRHFRRVFREIPLSPSISIFRFVWIPRSILSRVPRNQRRCLTLEKLPAASLSYILSYPFSLIVELSRRAIDRSQQRLEPPPSVILPRSRSATFSFKGSCALRFTRRRASSSGNFCGLVSSRLRLFRRLSRGLRRRSRWRWRTFHFSFRRNSFNFATNFNLGSSDCELNEREILFSRLPRDSFQCVYIYIYIFALMQKMMHAKRWSTRFTPAYSRRYFICTLSSTLNYSALFWRLVLAIGLSSVQGRLLLFTRHPRGWRQLS